MGLEKLKNKEDVLLSIVSCLLSIETVNKNIVQFVGNSKVKSLKDNEVILETKNKKFKINVSEL